MSYKGRYTLKKPEKYIGDAKKVVYRSLWEKQAFKWCENNPKRSKNGPKRSKTMQKCFENGGSKLS